MKAPPRIPAHDHQIIRGIDQIRFEPAPTWVQVGPGRGGTSTNRRSPHPRAVAITNQSSESRLPPVASTMMWRARRLPSRCVAANCRHLSATICSTPCSYEYLGTVEAPEHVRLMAGDSERVAGVHREPAGCVVSPRVARGDQLRGSAQRKVRRSLLCQHSQWLARGREVWTRRTRSFRQRRHGVGRDSPPGFRQ